LTTKTILYIEDDPASRLLVERALKHAGYRMLIAERGLEGMDIARREGPDLILTDINLPDMSGREISTRLRSDERFENTPIVALTAQSFDEYRHLAMAAGINGYLTKPIDIETLPEKIEYYLKGGRDDIDSEVLTKAQSKYAQEVVHRLETRIRELEDINTTLRRLDNMKDSFIQLTAHELRTPLTLVYGYSRLIEDNDAVKALLATNPDVAVLVTGLIESIERMQSIIDEILTISRIVTNQIDLSVGPTNLRRLIEKVIAEYEDAIQQRGLTLHFEDQDWPEKMQADSDLLQLTFSNLISNAIKYTPDGGHIYLSATPNEQNIKICVRDTGIGIDAKEQQNIFERFHTVHDPQLHSTSKTAFCGGGLGLGLAICKGIVEAHNGKIWVESAGQDHEKFPGSKFFLELPIMAAKERVVLS